MLDSLKKYTALAHVDFDDLIDSLHVVSVVVMGVNRVKGQMENMARRREILKKMRFEKGRMGKGGGVEPHSFERHKLKVVERCGLCSGLVTPKGGGVRCSV